MKKRSAFLVCIIPLLWGAFGLSAQQQSFTLQECIDFAWKNSLAVQNAKIEQLKSQSKVDEIIADGLPQINGSLNYTYNPDIQVQFIPDFISPSVYGVLVNESLLDPSRFPSEFATAPVAFGVKQNAVASATLKQLLFDGSFFIGLQAARTYTELYDKQAKQSKIDIAANVSKAYYAVLINKERLLLAEANVIRLDTLRGQTKAMYENGFSEKIDYDRIKVSFNNTKSLRNNLQRMVTISEQLLKFQMGMDVREPIALSENLSSNDITQPLANTGENSYGNRIEYSILETQEKLANLDIKRIQSMYLPEVYLNGSLGYNAGAEKVSDFKWNRFSSFGFTVSVPIFDGLRKMRQIEQAKLTAKQVQLAQQNLQNQVSFEQAQSEAQLTNALSNLESQKENMDLAQEVYRVSKVKYQEGVGSTLEVVNAEASYKEAENNYYNALYEAIVAKIDYDKAVGALSPAK